MLLFDMDGTLIDSNGIWKDVDTEFLARRGLPYTQAYYEGVAHTIFPLAAKFTKEFCHLPESEEEIMAEWMELAGDLYAGSVPEKPGVRAFLERMRARGERMAVVTSAVPVHCRSALTHLGLLPYFERIFFAQELGMEKKTPELWKKVAAELSRKYDVTGVHMFCPGADGVTAWCSNYAPLYDIPEECATGTSNGALTYYLYLRGDVKPGEENVFLQGEHMSRPSEIRSVLYEKDGAVTVRIGGRAVASMSCDLRL